MKPNLFQAIDRIGDRLAARLDWETMSGLPWGEVQPYLVPAPGKLAREVLDPGDPGQRLAVWPRENALTILESQEIPAHREPLEVEQDACILHRINVTKLGADLAGPIGFIPSPAKNGRDFHRIGMVQVPNRATVDVFLLVPQTPGSAKLAAQRLVVGRGGKETIVLLPSARWTEILPAFPPSFEVRVLAEFLQTEESDSLIAVVADAAPKGDPKLQRPAKSLPVRPDDKWSDLTVYLRLSDGAVTFQIDHRSVTRSLFGRSRKPNRMARMFGSLLKNQPVGWSVQGLPLREQTAKRRDFQRFKNEILRAAPVPDGDPFHYEASTCWHIPRFKIEVDGTPKLNCQS